MAADRPMKIAFCFLTLDDLHLPAIWDAFFAAAAPTQFGIHCHPKNPERVTNRLLRDRIVAPSLRVPTRHGDVSLVAAMLSLFASAFDEGDNDYFILASESTIPITSFSRIREDLARCSPRSLVNYRVPAPGSEHHARLDAIEGGARFAKAFYSHDSWLVLHRRHVVPLLTQSYLPLFGRVRFPDEHYFMNVLVHMKGVPADEFICRRTTFVNWKDREIRQYTDPATGKKRHTRHPKTYTTLAPSDLNAAGEAWFFRKVAASCDCTLVLERVASR
jgi:hypothetical protein